MTVASVLRKAQQIITPNGKWTQDALARDARGNEVKPRDERAKSFDMVGAIQRVECSADDYGIAIRTLRGACGKQTIFGFNDAHGHKAVLKAFGRAIRSAEAMQ